ncbi:MAG: GlsB/YeaQ/YmgE family stress response membrane protein [Brevibacterium yomogidense]
MLDRRAAANALTLASLLVGWIGALICGALGAVVGGWIGGAVFGTGVSEFWSLSSWLLAILGALIVLVVWGFISRAISRK